MPEGSVGVALGQVGITATDFSLDKVSGTWTGDSEQNGDTRSSEGRLNDQFFFTNTNVLIGPASLDQQPTTDEIAFNGNAPFTSNSHAIQAQPDTGLTDGEGAGVFGSVVNEDGSVETAINEYRAMIGDRPIGVSNVDVSADPSTPSGERAITEPNVLDAEKLSLVSFQPLPGLIGQRNGIVEPPSSSMLQPVWVRAKINRINVRFSMNSP